MKKTILYIFLLITILEASKAPKKKRGFDLIDLGYVDNLSINEDWKPQISSGGIDTFLPFQGINTADYNLKVNLGSPPPTTSIQILSSNSIEKPVEEAQEIVPPQSIGTAVLPQLPPPATPVNAAASNVPANQGAVFLGSGALGVVNLGNGAYALGSGSIGYSGNRAQTRPSAMVPVYPPLRASPGLVPAAVPSSQPAQPLPTIIGNHLDFNGPFLGTRQVDANGYEYLPPNRVGFGMPNPRPPRLRTTQQFATPTVLQFQPQLPAPPPPLPQQPQFQGASFNFDFPISQHGFP